MPANKSLEKVASCPCRLTINDERAYCDLPDGHNGNHSGADPRIDQMHMSPWGEVRVVEWSFRDMSDDDKERAMEAWEGLEPDGELHFYDSHVTAWLEQPADLATLLAPEPANYDAHVVAMREMGPPVFVIDGGVACDDCGRSFCADTEEECQIDCSEGYEEAYPSLCPLCIAQSNYSRTYEPSRVALGRMLALVPAHW